MAVKLHLGCGPVHLEGWENHDIDLDIRKPLPFGDNSVDFIFSEHCIEHITPAEGWRFMQEAHRVLKIGGVMRTAFPDPMRIYTHHNLRYLAEFNPWTKQPPTLKGSLTSIIEDWGHVAIWTVDSMSALLLTIGFDVKERQVGFSMHPELVGLESHGRIINQVEAMAIQTSVVEATKIA